MEDVKLMNRYKELVHSLYNSISQSKRNNFDDIREVLLKVYTKLDSSDEENIIKGLSEIGKYAGLNGVYRSSYGDKSQF